MLDLQESNKNILDQRLIRQHIEYEWFCDLIGGKYIKNNRENAVKYLAESPIYRNEVALFRARYLRNYASSLKSYRDQALRCYLIITEILGNEIDQTVLPIDFKEPSN